MSESEIVFSVFTKPWKLALPELGKLIGGIGFQGIELPVRPGYQVEPQNVARDLPAAVTLLREFGLRVTSVAGPADEVTIATCADVGVPIIRVMVAIGADGYLATEERTRRAYDALIPLLDRYRVTLGVQNHSGPYVCNAMGLRHLLEKYDPKHVCAIWDAAHNALDGEDPALALDIIWSHLGMVNLKNVFWQRTNGPEAETAEWRPYWTSGCQGLASWPRVAAELKKRHYNGVVCLTAEYTDETAVNRLIAQDLAFAQHLFLDGGPR